MEVHGVLGNGFLEKELLPLDQPLQQDFYAEMCRVERWSVRTLRAKIGSRLYERTAISKKPKEVLSERPRQRHPDLLEEYSQGLDSAHGRHLQRRYRRMIKRINTLKRIGRFTELKGGRGTDNDFVQLNVVYGSNASGKIIHQ